MSEDFDLMQDFPIPKKMDNEESMMVAKIINLQRTIKIEQAKLYGAINRYYLFKGLPRIHERDHKIDKYQAAIAALKEISEFGQKHSGYGYSCHRIAQKTLDKLTKEN